MTTKTQRLINRIQEKESFYDIAYICEDFQTFIDEISEFRLIGGEPLMNKGWADIVNGINKKHPDGQIFIYTNGTIAP